jgi:hypothetical protein
MATPKQRVQLLQLVLQKILRPRPRACGRYRAARYRRATPGHNPSSHLVCSFQGVARLVARRPGCVSILAVAFCAPRSPRCPMHRRPAARLSGLFVHLSVQGVVCAAFLAHIAGRWGRRASTVEIYSVEKVAECKLGAKSARPRQGTGGRRSVIPALGSQDIAMKKLLVSNVECFDVSSESASVTLMSEAAEVVVFCFRCDYEIRHRPTMSTTRWP